MLAQRDAQRDVGTGDTHTTLHSLAGKLKAVLPSLSNVGTGDSRVSPANTFVFYTGCAKRAFFLIFFVCFEGARVNYRHL